MTTVTLYRTKSDQYGVHGQIEDENGDVLCYTIERPWLDNAHAVSCIPEGTYPCEPHIKSNNGQHCWQVNNVPDRQGILIHTGNTDQDSEGCIIIGLLSNNEGVSESVFALQKLQDTLPSEFSLVITST